MSDSKESMMFFLYLCTVKGAEWRAQNNAPLSEVEAFEKLEDTFAMIEENYPFQEVPGAARIEQLAELYASVLRYAEFVIKTVGKQEMTKLITAETEVQA